LTGFGVTAREAVRTGWAAFLTVRRAFFKGFGFLTVRRAFFKGFGANSRQSNPML
jgi:hypothetical protein